MHTNTKHERPSRQQRQDERIIARIITAAHDLERSHGRALQARRGWGVWPTHLGIVINHDEQTCCAVGAGILFRGFAALAGGLPTHHLGEHLPPPLAMFARIHNVPIPYAYGVSDGFEDRWQPDDDSPIRLYGKIRRRAARKAAYERGYAVGRAIRAYVEVG